MESEPTNLVENCGSDIYKTKSSADSGYYDAPSLVSSSTRSSSTSILSWSGPESESQKISQNNYEIVGEESRDLLRHVGKTMPDIDWKMLETHLKVSQLENDLPSYMIDQEAIRAKLAADSSSEEDASFSDASNPNRIQATYGFNGWDHHSPNNNAHTDTGSLQHGHSGPSPDHCGCPVWATKMRHHRSRHERRVRPSRTPMAPAETELRTASKSEPGTGSSFNLQICFMNDPVGSCSGSRQELRERDAKLHDVNPAANLSLAPPSQTGLCCLEQTTGAADPLIASRDCGLEDGGSGAQPYAKRRTTRSTGESSIKTTRKNVRTTPSPIGNGSTGLSSRRRKYAAIRARREQIKHLRCLLYPLVVASNGKTTHTNRQDLDPLLLERARGHESPTTCCPDFVFMPTARPEPLTQVKRSEGSGTSGSDEYEEFYDGIIVDTNLSRQISLQQQDPKIDPDTDLGNELEDARFRLQEQAKIALSQAPLMARMQVEVERELKKLAILQSQQPALACNGGGAAQCRTTKNGIGERAKSSIAQKLFGRCKMEDKLGGVQRLTNTTSPHSPHSRSTQNSSPALQPCQNDYSNHRDEVESMKTLPARSPVIKEDRASKPSLKYLCNTPIAQLQILANRYLSNIEALNEELVQLLMERDDLHMEQDSILVDIEDITGRVQENTRKNQKSPHQQIDQQTSMCGFECGFEEES